jgi:hypothetical protein
MENVSSVHQPKAAGPEEYDLVIHGGGTGSPHGLLLPKDSASQ